MELRSGGESGSIRVVVIGDQGTGKTSLIVSCLTESFPDRPAPVLPPTSLPPEYFPDRVPLVLVDTSSRRQDVPQLEAECKRADAVVVTYACDRPETLDNVSTHWLPLLRQLQVTVPVIVVGCKLDRRTDGQPSLEALMAPIMNEFREIETCLECSALRQIQVPAVFYYAQKAVLHPTAPLFDQQTQTLRPRCVRALKRIFMLCDTDRDGVLNDAELNAFQVECFSAPLQVSELEGVKKVVREKMPDGITRTGLTHTGFLFLHALFIERGRLETTWTVLRRFGYADNLELKGELTAVPSFERKPDQSVELTPKALLFLQSKFEAFNKDTERALQPADVEELFSTAPFNPWEEGVYPGAAETSSSGAIRLPAFLSLFALMTLLEPRKALAQLLYLGLPSPQAQSASFSVTRRRRQDRRMGSSQRRTVQCFMFGPSGAGKTALLDAFVGRSFQELHKKTQAASFAVNAVDFPNSSTQSLSADELSSSSQTDGRNGRLSPSSSTTSSASTVPSSSSKFLVLREVPEPAVPAALDSAESLGACDVAVFVYDSSSLESFQRATVLLELVAARSESLGVPFPCLLVSAKDDLEPHPDVIPRSARLCAEMSLLSPVPVSSKLADTGKLWVRVMDAAAKPHLGVPETSTARSTRSARKKLLCRSLTYALAGTAIAVVLVVGYRSLWARRHSTR